MATTSGSAIRGTALMPGDTVTAATTGATCGIADYLGGGGQGEVYRADLGGRAVAVKWYLREWATPEQRRVLDLLVRRGPPSAAFLWPIDVVTSPVLPGFGYVMPLRPARFHSLADLVRRQVEPTFRAVVTAAMWVAHDFLLLHAGGFCYRDISFGNVFFDPANGDVLVCDNDNAGVDGDPGLGLMGTPRFMAPEIVRGEAVPSTATDLHSLAVLLFYMLFVHHPLEGAREHAVEVLDAPAMDGLYGRDPVFIFDDDDASNRPVAGEDENALAFWRLYPAFIRALFRTTFTAGLRDPSQRVREGEWRTALADLRDLVVYCPDCGAEAFVDPRPAGGARPAPVAAACWQCGAAPILPLHLRFDDRVVMLNHDTALVPHHLDPDRPWDFRPALATVTRHRLDPRIWGLRNDGWRRWHAERPDGTVHTVDPGHAVRLVVGTRIRFGPCEGVIEGPAAKGGRSP